MLMPLLAAAAAPVSAPVAWERIDLPSGVHRPVPIAAEPVASAPGRRGQGAERTLRWPEPPPATMAGVRGSPMRRARDGGDASRWPALAVAKLFRLAADGSRAGSACTAEFVGPRHLVTAGHCVVDRSTGQPYPALELAAGFDAGRATGTARVTAAWVGADLLRPAAPADAIVTPDRCGDLVVIAIDAPLGQATGWLGMSAATPAPGQPLYRFSYPHQSNTVALAAVRDRPGTSAAVRAAIDAAIAKARAVEPSFSPDDLYFDASRAGRVENSFLAEPSDFSLPGRSGSALLDADGAMLALMSRSYGGTTYSCRFDAATIGAVRAIVAGRVS